MSESEPIDLSNLMNLQFRPDWVEDLSKKDPAAGEVVWGRAPGSRFREDREDRPRRDGGPPRRDGGRGFDRGPRPGGPGGFRRDDRGPRPGQDNRGPRPGGPRPDFRGPGSGPGQAQGNQRPGPPRGERRDDGPRGPRRDDRGGRPPFRGGNDRGRDGERFGPPRGEFREALPLEGWAASLVPDPRAVDSIVRQIKSSGRAFAVFDVGRLFMKSRGSYQVAFARRQPGQAPRAKEGQPAPEPQAPRGPAEIHRCEADGSLWVTRDEALRHILHSPALAKYYRSETVTVDAPKGNWNSVAVCGFSGALLGPPNHHDYQRNVARLHRERFSDMSLDRYKSRIRVEKDEALLAKWQEQQSSITQWVPVTEEPLPEGTEPPAPLKSQSEMEAHFLRTHAATAVTTVARATVPGTIPGRSLSAPLFTLLRREVEHQQRFPMQLVQDLCRSLETHGLRFFKRDKKSTFVCRNRPHFLPDDLVLSDRIRTMVEIVRANPGIKYSQLVSILAPSVVLAAGPPPEKSAASTEAPPVAEGTATPVGEEAAAPTADAAPAEPVVAEAPVPAAVESPEVSEEPAPSEPAAEAPIAESEAPGAEAVATETPATDAPAAEPDAPAAEAPAAEEGAAAPVTAPVAPAPAQALLSPEEIAILQDLHWLVQEGYVTEFQNGELFVLGRPPQPPQEKKPRGPCPDKAANSPAPAAGESAAEAPPGAPEIEVIDAASVSAAVPEGTETTTVEATAAESAETPAAPASPAEEAGAPEEPSAS